MNQISLAEYRQQIEDAIQGGRYEEAVAHGRHILERYPKYIGAYWLLGKAMLEAGHNDQATDMFQRVLSADPEHMLAWVGMSETAKRRDALEDAVWYLQRAFELATDNEMVAEELRHLYGELEGSEPERLQLTESALAKLYLRGDLLTRAIAELRKLIEEHPERLDLRVALAEALWRDGQRLQASQVSQEILEEQPYVLKANLILGEIWSSSGRTTEADTYLERAEALDPENEMAQELFGSASPLPPEEPEIEPMTREGEAGEEQPAWLAELGEAAPVEAEEAMEAEIEIPAWLQELASEPAREVPAEPEEEEIPTEAEKEAAPVAEIEAEPEAEALVEPTAPEAEELPEEEAKEAIAVEEIAPEEMPEDDVLDWLEDLEEEEIPPGAAEEVEEEEDVPAWLAEVEEAPEEEAMALEAEEAPEGPEPAEIPDWLRDLAPPAAEPRETAPPEALEAIFEEEEDIEEPEAEEVEPEEAAAREIEVEEPETEAPEEKAELPAWLESDEMPSGDDALAWLAQLAEGKEEELRAQAEIEGEARLAEILGQPEEAAEEAPPVEEEPEAVEAEAEAEALEEEPFGWTAFEEREEVAPEAEEVAPVEEAEVPEAAPEEAAPEAVAKAEAPAPEEEEEAVLAPEEPAPEAVPAAEEEVPPVEERVPEEAAPEEIAPEEAAPEEAAPEKAVAEAEAPAPEEEEEAVLAPEEPAPEAVPAAEEEVPPVEGRVPEEAAPEEVAPEEEEEAVPAPEEAAPEVVEPVAEEIAVPEGVSPAEAMEEAPAEEDLERFISAQRAYAEEHPDDHEARLELGRVLWQADKRSEAVEAYERLVDEEELLDDVIADLEDYSEQWPDARVMQSLGDAYMRTDRLQDALDTYRQALASL